jgi:tetratricopeptide (TPR) repeat protein
VRENGYIATARAYFEIDETHSEAERLAAFEGAYKSLAEGHPDDQNAKAFYVLAQLATVDSNDKTYSKRKIAGSQAGEVLAAVPNHPGAQHYTIHAFDVPGLAERALPVARQYGVVAPNVPHALHMMSHIFTRLGLWDESIEWNERSAVAALKASEEQGEISMHYLHALDYLIYAHLQKGEDAEALEYVQTMASLKPPFGNLSRTAHAYAFAASPSRYALERHDWARAADLGVRIPTAFPWEDSQSHFVAITHFSRGLGMAHESRFADARSEIEILRNIEEATNSPYWKTQVEIQRRTVEAWVMFLSGDKDGGLAEMKAVSALYATAEKSPVTPGEVLPASELLGDMHMVLGHYEEAIIAYRATLVRSPHRLNSLQGIAKALELSGEPEAAKAYSDEIDGMVR